MKVQISIKFKLLLLTSGLVTLALLANHYLSVEEFKRDKIAYVFFSSLANAQNTATHIRGDLNFGLERIRSYLRLYNPEGPNFLPRAYENLNEDQFLVDLQVYQLDPDSGRYQLRSRLSRESGEEMGLSDELIQETLQQEVSLGVDPSRRDRWRLSVTVPVQGGGEPLLASATFQEGQFLDHFFSPKMQNTYLINEFGEVLISPARTPHELDEGLLARSLKELLPDLGSASQVKEINDLLISFSQVGAGNLSAVSLVPRAAALEGLQFITLKSTVLVIVLIAIAIIFSVLGSNQLTANIFRLYDAMKMVTAGNLDSRAQVKSQDEIGVLAQGFNHMTAELQRLLAETAEKARMASELATARTVQSTLFPHPELVTEEVEVQGFYEPASECGGDWWHYYISKERLYLWIGDATGHGVPAALITSAARSASSVLESLPDLSTAEAMRLLNKAVCETSKGQVMMTFFLGCLDLKTGELRYTSASHDPPFLLPQKEGKLSKKDVLPLMDSEGKRLGESLDSEYEEKAVQLNPGDRLFLYTDGVTEIVGPEQSQWGERQLIKTLLHSINSQHSLKQGLEEMKTALSEFKQDTPLADDVTYYFVQLKKVINEH